VNIALRLVRFSGFKLSFDHGKILPHRLRCCVPRRRNDSTDVAHLRNTPAALKVSTKALIMRGVESVFIVAS
jgi:hypothetical protein